MSFRKVIRLKKEIQQHQKTLITKDALVCRILLVLFVTESGSMHRNTIPQAQSVSDINNTICQ